MKVDLITVARGVRVCHHVVLVLTLTVAGTLTGCAVAPNQPASLPSVPSTPIPFDRLFARTPANVSAWDEACTHLAAARTEVTCSVEMQPMFMLLIGFNDESALARHLEAAISHLALPFCRTPEVVTDGWVVLAVATPPLASVYDCSSGQHSGFFRRRAGE